MILWKKCLDQLFRLSTPDSEILSILTFCHDYACGDHFSPKSIARKVLDSGFYLYTLFIDSHVFM